MGTLRLIPTVNVVTFPIRVSGVCERDIDLLLLEEFVASLDFLQWFSSRVTDTSIEVEKLLNAQRSVTQSNGESDLEILLQDSTGEKRHLLIENKVNANFQPQQAERYRSRGQGYQQSGSCNVFQTILVAPERYFGSETALKGFDARVTYEEIRDWFKVQRRDVERQRYKVELLTAAITKRTVGYQRITDAPVSEFWYQYWKLSKEQAPILNMEEPDSKGARACFIPFKPASLPAGIKLIHKLSRGNVDLQFRGMAEDVNKLRHQFESVADSDMRFVKAAKSGCIRLQVPRIDTAHEFDTQKEYCILGIRAATRLLSLYEKAGRGCVS